MSASTQWDYNYYHAFVHPQTVLPNAARGVDFEVIAATRERIMKAGLATNTQIAYASAWKIFVAWCDRAQRESLPASEETLLEFAAWSISEGFRLQTVTARLCGVAHHHREAGFASPLGAQVSAFMVKAKRDRKEEPRGKSAVTRFHIVEIAKRLKDNPIDVRNRTMILLAFVSGWRRSEVSVLQYADVQFVKEGMTLWLRSSKTDQQAKGRSVGVHKGRSALTCPVRAMKEWLKIRGHWDGPLFVRFTPVGAMTRDGLDGRGQVLYNALKEALNDLGEDPRRFGAHSLRAGMVTEASKAGATEASIMRSTGHSTSAMLQRYIRPAKLFDMNPMRGVL